MQKYNIHEIKSMAAMESEYSEAKVHDIVSNVTKAVKDLAPDLNTEVFEKLLFKVLHLGSEEGRSECMRNLIRHIGEIQSTNSEDPSLHGLADALRLLSASEMKKYKVP